MQANSLWHISLSGSDLNQINLTQSNNYLKFWRRKDSIRCFWNRTMGLEDLRGNSSKSGRYSFHTWSQFSSLFVQSLKEPIKWIGIVIVIVIVILCSFVGMLFRGSLCFFVKRIAPIIGPLFCTGKCSLFCFFGHAFGGSSHGSLCFFVKPSTPITEYTDKLK